MSPLLPKTAQRIARSPYQSELRDFAAWLVAEQYDPAPIHQHVARLDATLHSQPAVGVGHTYAAAALTTWFESDKGPPSQAIRNHALCRAYTRFLRDRGRLCEAVEADPVETLCAAYLTYLRDVRGLVRTTRRDHGATVRDFLRRGVGSAEHLSQVTPEILEAFVQLRSREISRESLVHVVGHLRAFLCYGHDQGLVARRLDHTLEIPLSFRAPLPPGAMPWDAVQTLLQSVDTDSRAGWRDRCLLHLLAHYGLRPVEVAHLALTDIHWDTGSLQVQQSKTRSTLVLPLASPTLQLLRDYLQAEREAQGGTFPHLFLRARCPRGPLSTFGVRDVFRKRLRQSPLPQQHWTVYALRHAFALRLHARGVGLKAIGDVLGHRDIATTCHYLRLDIEGLRGVPLDVPDRCPVGGGSHA